MLVMERPGADKPPAELLFSVYPLPGSNLSPVSKVGADDLSFSLSPPITAGNEPLIVAAATVDVDGTELESPSRRTKFTYVLTNPVELNFGRQIGSHDAEAELL